MQIDTGQFMAIKARADAADALAGDDEALRRHLAAQEWALDRTFDAGYVTGRASAALPVQVRAAGGRHVRPRAGRPGYLRLVSGGGGAR